MAWAGLLGGLLGAGGSIAGGLMGQADGGSPRSSTYNPSFDLAIQAAQFDALNQLGFGNINNIPDPFQQLSAQINALPWVEKSKQKALLALQNIRQDPTLLDDPYGNQFSRDEIFQANKTGAPFGRRVSRGSSGGGTSAGANAGIGAAAGLGAAGPVGALAGGLIGAFGDLGSGNDTEPNALRVEGINTLEKSLRAMGMSLGDLQKKLKQQQEYEAQVKRLNDAGLGRLNENTILNRAGAANASAQLLGDAGRFATGGDPSALQTGLMDRLNRNINDQETQYLLRAQYGGFNPSGGLQGIRDMRQDSDLTALTQAVQMAGALTAGLNGGGAAGAGAAAQSSNSSLGALGISANQAMAANGLAQQRSINNSDSMANGIAGGLSGLGNSLLFSSMMSGGAKPGMQQPRTFLGTGTETGFRFSPLMLGGAMG